MAVLIEVLIGVAIELIGERRRAEAHDLVVHYLNIF